MARSQDRQQAFFSPGQAYRSPASPRDGELYPVPVRPPAPGAYGVAPVGKVHSGTPLCAGEPMVVCSDWIHRVAFGEPRMM